MNYLLDKEHGPLIRCVIVVLIEVRAWLIEEDKLLN